MDLNWELLDEEVKMTQKYLWKYSASLANREMQIKSHTLNLHAYTFIW